MQRRTNYDNVDNKKKYEILKKKIWCEIDICGLNSWLKLLKQNIFGEIPWFPNFPIAQRNCAVNFPSNS